MKCTGTAEMKEKEEKKKDGLRAKKKMGRKGNKERREGQIRKFTKKSQLGL
jgi:hypothetical protein